MASVIVYLSLICMLFGYSATGILISLIVNMSIDNHFKGGTIMSHHHVKIGEQSDYDSLVANRHQTRNTPYLYERGDI